MAGSEFKIARLTGVRPRRQATAHQRVEDHPVTDLLRRAAPTKAVDEGDQLQAFQERMEKVELPPLQDQFEADGGFDLPAPGRPSRKTTVAFREAVHPRVLESMLGKQATFSGEFVARRATRDGLFHSVK